MHISARTDRLLKRTIRRVLPLVLVLASVSPQATWADTMSVDAILDQVREAVHEHVKSAYPDSDAVIELNSSAIQRLKPCARVSVEPPNARHFGRLHVRVRCTADAPWTMYIAADVIAYADIPVAIQPIARGTVITANMLDVVKVSRHTLRPHTLTHARDIVGKMTKRPLRAAQPFSLQSLSQPSTIKKGQRVAIESRSGRIRIQSFGTALSAGKVGDQIEVVNETSNRTIRPWVAAPGLVTTTPVRLGAPGG